MSRHDYPTPKESPHTTELVEPWYSAFKDAGLVSPATGEPSMQAMYRETGLHVSAMSRIVSGKTKRPKIETIRTIAKALKVDVVTVASWIGIQLNEEPKAWVPPVEAELLDDRQRAAVEEMIRLLADNRGGENSR